MVVLKSVLLKQEFSTVGNKTSKHSLFDERYVIDMFWCHMTAKFTCFVD